MRISLIFACLVAAALAGCGGGGSPWTSGTSSGNGTGGSSSSGGSGSSSSGGTTSGPPVTAITETSSTPSILADGSTTASITALVRDSNNNLVAGVPVTFTATSGGIAVTGGSTNTSGAATATLSTAGDVSLRTITVTAKAGGKSATVQVKVVTGASSSTVQLGSPAGAGFQASKIGISSTSLSAGGSTTLTVALQQSDGTLYNQSAAVTFSSPCAAQNKAQISSPITTSTGVATATYVSTGCSGTDPITATATVGGNALSATGAVTVAASTIGSIIYKSASNLIISLKGSGTSDHPETSTVLFQVLDSSGAPSTGVHVTFALNTTVGGLSLIPGPVTSDANGNVQTTVQGGTVATPVRVTATIEDTTPTISTQSNQLSVSTGIPTQNEFSLAVKCENVEALNIDGVQVAVTARLADRFSNPVADGTAVQFNAEGGHILPQCTTTTNATEGGVCSVTWTSADPRPTVGKAAVPPAGGSAVNRPGRATLMATAIGEESFVDANGNGVFDPGETWYDLGERFRDDNGNGTYDHDVTYFGMTNYSEIFYDFNNDGVRNGPDGLFNGVLCNDPAHCDPTKTSTGIGQNAVIVMAGSTPAGIYPAGGATLGPVSHAAGTYLFNFTVADVNNNPMPAGTTISASVSGTGFALTTGYPSTYTYPCTDEPIDYAFSLTSSGTGSASESLQILLDIKSPGGIETFVSYPVTVN